MAQLPQVPSGGQTPANWPAVPAAGPIPYPRPEMDYPMPAAGPDLRFVSRVLLGRKWLIASMVTVVTGLSAVGVSLLEDKYTSNALLLVDNRQVRIVQEADQVLGTIPASDEALLSEIEILKSNQVLGQVLADLKLADNPDFNPPAEETKEPTLGAQALGYARQLTARVWGDAPPAVVADALGMVGGYVQGLEQRDARHEGGSDRILERLRRKLDVLIVGRSRVIRVEFTAKDPELAAAVVQKLVARYMETRQQMDRALATGAISWLQDRIGTLQKEVQLADHELEQVRFKSGLMRGQAGGPMAVQELEQTRLRLSEAAANRARMVAQADALERYERTGNWNAIGGSIASPVVAQLRATVSTLQTEMAQVSKQYGPKHPRLMDLQARLGEASSSLQNEIRREINGVREAASVAVEQEKALKEMVAGLETRYTASASDDGVKLRQLEAEATAKHQLLDSLLKRLEEVQAQQDNRAFPTGVKLISPAQVPHQPSGPFRTLLTLAGFAAALLLAITTVFALELMRRRVRTPDAIRRTLGITSIHVVPHHTVRGRRAARLYEIFQTQPFSLFSEAMRALFRNHLSDVGPIGSIAVTSARPRDGKTSLTLATAQVAAQAGRRVVVVDTDFRRSRIDDLFALSGKPGLSDWIAGTVTLDEILYESSEVPFAMVPAGRLISSTLDRFNVDCLVDLMAALSPRYDLVVFDTAPVLAVSDARVVCAAATKVLFVARWGHTTQGDLDGVADIGPIDPAKFVCALTDVNLKKAASRGYEGPYRNYMATRKYYGEPTRLREAR
ncbi:MAG TPA: polysaccharide biosynthesis tyrosine autokinase [Azospirillum sp.]